MDVNQFPFCLPCLGFAKKSEPQRVWGDHGFPLLVVACLHCKNAGLQKLAGWFVRCQNHRLASVLE